MKIILRIVLVMLSIEILFFSLVWLNKKFDFIKISRKAPVKLTQNFPNLPLVSKTNLVASSKETINNNDRFSGVWQTSDSIPNVVNWYLENLPKNGWTPDTLPSNLKATDIQYLTAVKDKLYLQLSLVRKSNKTEITADVTDKSLKK